MRCQSARVIIAAAMATLTSPVFSSSFMYINRAAIVDDEELGAGQIVVSRNIQKFIGSLTWSSDSDDWYGDGRSAPLPENGVEEPYNGTTVLFPRSGFVQLNLTDTPEDDCDGVGGQLDLTFDRSSSVSLTFDVLFFKEKDQCYFKFTQYEMSPQDPNNPQPLPEVDLTGFTHAYHSATGLNDPVAVLSSCRSDDFQKDKGCPHVSWNAMDHALGNIPFSGYVLGSDVFFHFVEFVNNASLSAGNIYFSEDSNGLYPKNTYPFPATLSSEIGHINTKFLDEDRLDYLETNKNQTITYAFDDGMGEIVVHVHYVKSAEGEVDGVNIDGLEVHSEAITRDKDITVVYTMPLSAPFFDIPGTAIASQVSVCYLDDYKENCGCIANQHKYVVDGFNVPSLSCDRPQTQLPEPQGRASTLSGAVAAIIGVSIVGLGIILGLASCIIFYRCPRTSLSNESTSDESLEDQSSIECRFARSTSLGSS
eukprot:Clim_evm75s33 gene=Clim_evmTU75s33